LNTGVSGSAVLDEDDFASDSATKVATQQSIKAYIATQTSGSITASSTTTLTNKTINASNNTLSNIPVSATALTAGTGISLSTNTLNVDAAQTGITSLLATDIKIGEDDQTKVDFETANEIHLYADNANKVTVDANGMTLNTGALQLKNGSTSAGKIEFFEDSDNGTNKVTLIGPASTSDITLTLPSSDGDSGQVLTTDGSGVTSWATASSVSTAKVFFMGQI